MSKYKERGPYHFVEFCDENSPYHAHVMDLVVNVAKFASTTICRESAIHVWDVGCGEGLILHQLWRKLQGFNTCTGFDSDSEAIRMARLLVPQLKFEHLADVTRFKTHYAPDLIMFCDSLEHIESWEEHVRWATRISSTIVIATPSKHDPHGVNDFSISAFDQFFFGWELVHRKSRDHRNLSIWMRHRL